VKILLKVTPTLERVLAAGPERGDRLHIGPANLSHSSNVQTQVVQPLRAAFSKATNRDGMQTRVSFSVNVTFPDTQEAETYALNYPNTLEREGEVWFVSRLNDVETVKKLLVAVIDSVTTSQFGVNITINYSIVGGQFL
jgi:hypothetical protein